MTEMPGYAREAPAEFSLLGGPLHRLGLRLGLVRGDTNTVRLGLVLGGGMWLILAVLTVAEGHADLLVSLSIIGVSARLLVVVPLLFLCESWVAPRMAAFVRRIAELSIVPASALPALDAEMARTRRWTNGWWSDAACLLSAILLAIAGARLQGYGASSGFDPARTELAAWVYYSVCLTVFRFLVLRWVWRLGLWSWVLWRVSRLDLHLIPGHPDGAGGLQSVASVHERFTPLVAALSVIACAALVEDLSVGKVAIGSVYPILAILLLVDAAVFLGPLLVFTDKLWACRTKGMQDYMSFAGRYVDEFERKWLGSKGTSPAESMLGTADIQSLADLANSVNIVRNMRWVPIGVRLLVMMTAAALLPLAPLLLFKYPLATLTEKFFTTLVGL